MSRHRADELSLQALHDDAGLQPERTTLAWSRTLLLWVVVACTFLRWIQTEGLLGILLALVSLLTALYLGLTQRRRYRRSAQAIRTERHRADVASVMLMGAMVVCLAAVSLWAVLERL
ncbi:DUF202 domain-containing protein [Pseudomonas juntendi]|uniref:DUF202 domain-containing protein n=1 Tax=Pseudomonas juntendi TaxID=2666183 RepID=UPI001F35790F|nr:DUF202 domain-containing protein [Pseudomonas juntendi]MCO7054885.1 DUF202 domain-containing protein [Pseudomonas juntendi]UJM14747.1 DUF202 domain-containing protein [Pseudomonas juntendi]